MTRHTCAGAHVSAWYSCGAFPQRHTARAAGLGSPLRGSLSHRDSGQRPSSLVGVEPRSLAPGAAAAAMDAGTADLARRRWGGPTSDVSNN